MNEITADFGDVIAAAIRHYYNNLTHKNTCTAIGEIRLAIHDILTYRENLMPFRGNSLYAAIMQNSYDFSVKHGLQFAEIVGLLEIYLAILTSTMIDQSKKLG